MELDKAIKSRQSIRKFSNKKPDWRDILEAIDYSKYAPMAGNNFTLNFILIDEKEKIKKIAEATQQPWVAQAHYLVAVCSNSSRLKTSYGEKGKDYNKQQIGAGIQNFLLKLEELKLSTCWIGYFVERIVKEQLNIPEEIEIEALFPIGYKNNVSYTRKEKPSLESFIHFNKFGNKKMKESKKVN